MSTRQNGSGSKVGTKTVKARKLALTEDEVKAVLVACKRYRHTIPVYLASSQSELQLIRAVIRKLT
jgi:hypothetical protein